MARIYDVVCLKCGHQWEWCKYDAPDTHCPGCGRKVWKRGDKWLDRGFISHVNWDTSKVCVFGVGSTGKDIERCVKEVKAGLDENRKRAKK